MFEYEDSGDLYVIDTPMAAKYRAWPFTPDEGLKRGQIWQKKGWGYWPVEIMDITADYVIYLHCGEAGHSVRTKSDFLAKYQYVEEGNRS